MDKSSSIVRLMPKAVRTVGSNSSASDIAEVLAEDGCVIIADLATAATMDRIRAEIEPYLDATGGGNTDFLGEATQRTGALIARSPTARSLITHPTIIDTLDLVLGDHASTFQVDLTQLVTIGPGASAQMIHRDQQPGVLSPAPYRSSISPMRGCPLSAGIGNRKSLAPRF